MLRDLAHLFRRPFSFLALRRPRRPIRRDRRRLRLEDLEGRILPSGDYLVITTPPPSTVLTNTPFTVVVQVDLDDAVDTGYSGSISVAINSGPVGAALGETTPVPVTNGLAQFDNLTVTQPSGSPSGSASTLPVDYVLQFSAPNAESVTTSQFAAAALAVTNIEYTSEGGVQFAYTVTGAPLPTAVPVSLFWANGPTYASAIAPGPSGTGPNYVWDTIPAGQSPQQSPYTVTIPGSILVGSPVDAQGEPLAQDLLVVLGDPENPNLSADQDIQALSLDLGVTRLSQGGTWASNKMDNTSYTIGGSGCMLTDLDMALNYLGLTNPTTGEATDPGWLNAQLSNANGGYCPGALLNPARATQVVGNVLNVSLQYTPSAVTTTQQLLNLLTSTGEPVIVQVANPHAFTGTNATDGNVVYVTSYGSASDSPFSDSRLGALVNSPAFPPGTTIVGYDEAAGSITLSQDAIASSNSFTWYSSHFVLVTGPDPAAHSFYIADPGYSTRTTLAAYVNTGYGTTFQARGYVSFYSHSMSGDASPDSVSGQATTFDSPSTDESLMYVASDSADSDVSLSVADTTTGQTTGIGAPGSAPADNIPNSFYSDDGPLEGSNSDSSVQYVYVEQPGDEDYTIASDGSGDYTLATGGESPSGQLTSATEFTASASSVEANDVTADSADGAISFPQETPEVTVTANNMVYNGSPDVATATITDANGDIGATLEGYGCEFTYYAGTTVSGTSGTSAAPTEPGTYTVVAVFPGSTDYTSASDQTTFTISPQSTSGSTTVPLDQALDTFDTGAGAISTNGVGSIVGQALGMNGASLPLVGGTLDGTLGISDDLLTPVQNALSLFEDELAQGASEWQSVAADLSSAGFSVVLPFTGTPQAKTGNLFEINWSLSTPVSNLPLLVSGTTGFSYLDNGGGIFGPISGSGNVTVSLTFGVDINAQDQLGFFIAPSTSVIQATLTGSTAPGALTGTLDIGDLANVNATATGSLSITGTLGLQPSAADTDGKIRVADLTNTKNLGQVVTGGVNGSVEINANFDVQLSSLPDIKWSGTFGDAVVNSVLQSPTVKLEEPSVSSLLSSLGASLFSLGDGIPVLGPLSDALNQPLPLIDESIAELTGLDSDLPELPELPDNLDDLNGVYPDWEGTGGTLTVNVTPTSIDQFLRGQPVNLISWEASNDISLIDENITIPIYSFGVPDVISAEIDATFGIHASLDYNVGFGLDGRGFWLLAGSPSNPNLGLTFGVTAGVQGQVEVFGFPLAEAGGDIGFAITPYITLTAPPWAADPSKVYMSDLALFGSNPFSDFLDDLSVGIQGAFTGELYASIDLFLFSLSWHWGISIPVFNFEHHPTWPAEASAGAGGPASLFAAHVTQNGGVLTFTGTAGSDNLNLSEGTGGSVTIDWAGVGTQTYPGPISQFNLVGAGGNERLTTAPGFAIPIDAQLNGKADYVKGGAGNDTLIAGNGNDTLVAGTGNDSLVGGNGTDLLVGGSGSDTIVCGNGTDSVFGGGPDSLTGGTGASTIDGGSGTDSIYCGAGNDTINVPVPGDPDPGSGTYYIDGGSGSDTIYGGTGAHDSIYGGGGGDNLIHGSSGGYDLIYGGGPSDTIYGAGGHDTIYGGAGKNPLQATNNVIYGGDQGYNLIYGAGAGDELYGAAYTPGTTYGGNNTIYGGAGVETLYGGDGTDLVPNVSGDWDAAGDNDAPGGNLLVAGKGNDVLFSDATGKNTLVAGAGNDVLWAGGAGNPGDGDYLAAGTGVDSLYGGPGNDTFQLAFTPTGQEPDVVVGGPGVNSVVLKPDDLAAPTLLQPISATATTLDVTDSAALAGVNASNFVIAIDHEQMEVTAVNGDTLTVVRGVNNTVAVSHSAGAAVVAQTPSLENMPSLADPITDTTSTTLTVNDAAALAPTGAPNFVVQVDNEQMLVENIQGSTLTVQRGYDGTTAATHVAGAPLVVEKPTLVVNYATLASPITSTTATSLTVSDAVTLSPKGTAGFSIQVDDEQMLVTAVNLATNTLTVQRGYDNTIATTHASGTNVVTSFAPALDPAATTITVANAALLADGSNGNFVIQIDQEQMLVTAVDPATDTLTVERGYNGTTAGVHWAGTVVAEQPILQSAASAASTTLTVSDAAGLVPANGYDPVIQIDSEQMLVTAASGDTLTVERGYDNSTAAPHASGALIAALIVDRPTLVVQSPTLVNPVADTTSTTLTVSDVAALDPTGANFVIQVDDEQMLVTGANLTSNTLTVVRGYSQQTGNTTTGSTTIAGLASTSGLAVGQPVSGAGIPSGTTIASIASPTSISLSEAATATASGVVLGFSNGPSAATHAAGAVVSTASGPAIDPNTTTITVANAALLGGSSTANFIIQVDQEQMLVTAVNLTTNTLTVERGYNGTTAAAHFAGAPVSVQPTLVNPVADATSTTLTVSDAAGFAPANGFDPVIQIDNEQMLVTAVAGNTLTVVRGFNNTTAAPHDAGALVLTAGQPVLDPATTTIPVANAAALAASSASNFVIRVDQEQMLVTGVNLANDTLTVVRGTTPSTHAAGADVTLQTPALPQPSDYEIYLTQGAATDTGTTTAGSNTITGLASTATLTVGEAVTGPGIPASTTITAIASGTSITISSAATATAAVSLDFGTAGTASGNTTAGSSTITGLANATQFVVGEPVSGPGIPSGTTIAGIISAGSVTLSNVAGATATGAILTFGMYQATLYDLDTGDTLGQANFAMPPGVANLELEGGPGKNLIQVDPSVNEDISLYGGPGENTLMAGSGDDTLVAGSGTSVLYGGPGADVLYGGDLPQQDATPVLDPYESWSAETGTITQGSTTITLSSTTGLTDGQVVSGDGIPPGSTINSIDSMASTITITPQPATLSLSDVTIAFGSSTPEGHDTLIAGAGNSELYAGTGGDVLIGGSATLVNGQWVLQPGAGRDLLEGGAGNDLLIVGPGSPGSVLMAGAGNDILAAQNDGSNVMVSDTGGNDLFLGYAGSDNIDASGSYGNDTLVGGNGFNSLFGGNGTDYLYDYPVAAIWTQAQFEATNGIAWQQSGNLTGGSATITGLASTANLSIGQSVSGSGIPAGAIIASIPSNNSITLSSNATTTATAIMLTFSDPPFNVRLTSPFGPSSTGQDPVWTALDTLETEPQNFTAGSLAAPLQVQLQALGVTDTTGSQIETQLVDLQTQTPYQGNIEQLVGWLDEDPVAHNDLEQILLGLLDSPSGVSHNQQYLWRNLVADDLNNDAIQELQVTQQIKALAAVDFIPGSETAAQLVLLANESYTLSGAEGVASKLLGATDAADSLQAGNGTDYLYGNPSLPTWMAGGYGQDTFYNLNGQDTILGGAGNHNTLMFEGDGTFTLQPDATNPSIIDVGLATQYTSTQPGSVNGTAITGLLSTAALSVGEAVSGSGIPSGTTITAIVNATSITISNPGTIAGDEDLTFTETTQTNWQAGNFSTSSESITNLQVIAVQTGNADGDTVDLENLSILPAGLTGLFVKSGNGNSDVLDASTSPGAPITLLAGTGADTIRVGTTVGGGTVYQGNSLSELDIVDSQPSSQSDSVTVANNLLSIDGVPVNSQTGNTHGNTTIDGLTSTVELTVGQSVSGSGIPTGDTIASIVSNSVITLALPATASADNVTLTFGITFRVLKVVGNSSTTNTFSSDGTVSDVIFQGGSGSNFFTLNGPGNYTIDGSGAASNTLTFNSNDSANSDSVTLGETDYQSSATVSMTGSVNGSALSLVATNLSPNTTNITVNGGSGDYDSINAAAMNMGVTLNPGSGTQDDLTGGLGKNIVYVHPGGGQFDGGQGTANEVILSSSGTFEEPPHPLTITTLEYYTLTYNAATEQMTLSESNEVGGANPYIQTLSVPAMMVQLGAFGFESFQIDNAGSPGTEYAIGNAPLSMGTPTFAAAGLEATISDTYTGYDLSSIGSAILWGDSRSTPPTVTASNPVPQAPNSPYVITVEGDHVFAERGPHTITLRIVDSELGAATTSITVTSGLALNGGILDDYVGNTPAPVDTGVVSYVVQNLAATFTIGQYQYESDDAIFSLHQDGTLEVFLLAGSQTEMMTVDTNVQSIFLGPDGSVYALQRDGTLYAESAYNPLNGGDYAELIIPYMVASNVQAVVQDEYGNIDGEQYVAADNANVQATAGNLYTLTNGSLYVLQANGPASPGTLLQSGVESIALAPGGTAVDVVQDDGDSWQYRGTTGVLLGGPQFYFSPLSAVAGQPTTVTLNVLDQFGNPLTGYTGTVQFATSDAAAVAAGGPLPVHTFSAADNGSFTFTTTFLTAGTQTLTATDNAGDSTQIAVTVAPGAVASLQVAGLSSTVAVDDALPVTVTAYDAYGNVATNFTGSVALAGSDPFSTQYTFTPQDNGVHTFFIPFDTAGSQSVTASDTADTAIAAGSSFVVNPDPVDVAQCTVAVSPASVAVDGTAAITLTARDAHGNQETSGGLTVAFSVSGGGSVGPVTDDGDGTYTAAFTAGTAPGTYTITATTDGQPLTSQAPTITVLASPGGTITNATPTFAWPAVAGATSYTLAVTDNTTKKVVLDLVDITATTYTPTASQALTPGHSYTWTADGISASGHLTVASSNVAFTVAPLGVPTAASPNAAIATDMPTFTWLAVADAAHSAAGSFTIKVIDKATGSVLTIANLTGTSYTLSPKQALTPGHSYTWSITAVSSNGQASVASKAGSNPTFTVAPLAAPVPNGPAGSLSTDIPTFFWAEMIDALHTAPGTYTVTVTDKTSGQVLTVRGLTTTAYTLLPSQALTPGHRFTWSVTAVSTNGTVTVASSASANPTFTIDPIAAPVPESPTGTVSTDTPTFTWSEPTASSTAPASYTLRITDDTTHRVLTITGVTIASYTLTAKQALVAGHRYTWSVAGVSTNAKDTVWSASLSFSTL